MIRIKLHNPKFIRVKIAGGSTAQILGLMSAVFVSKKMGKPFKIIYYPYSTGTYWPLAIGFLLSQDEILSINKINSGIQSDNSLEVGKIIKKHPLINKKISYEHFLLVLRKIKLMPFLLVLRRELSSTLNPKKILRLRSFYTTLSGKFPMLNIDHVNIEMDYRFNRAQIPSPFSKDKNFDLKNIAVIHYRLGDKRTATHILGDFNDDGIIDPSCYKRVVEKIPNFNNMNTFVVSDEPLYAQKLLGSIGIKANVYNNKGSIWDDLYLMSQSNIFIGAINSQVTQLANICVENNGGRSFILVPKDYKVHTKFTNTTFFESFYINQNSSVYNFNFSLEMNAHSAYGRNNQPE